jgi:cell division protein FtsQ
MNRRRRINKVQKRSRLLSLLKKRGLWKVSALLVLLLSVVFILRLLYIEISERLTVRQIQVIGNHLLSDREILSMGGLRRGESILNLKTAKVREKLIQSSWIKEAYVRKELPHRVLVYVQEVKPVALLQRGKRFYMIDREGNILEEIKEVVSFLPVIRISRNHKGLLKEALLLARVIRNEGFFPESEVRIEGTRPEDLTIVVDGRIIKIGKGKYRDKLIRLVQVEKKIENKAIPVEFVDLRFDKRVIVRVKREG